MKRISCIKCKLDFASQGFKGHSLNCDGSGRKADRKRKIKTSCKFCNIIILNYHSLGAHTVWCAKRPNLEEIREKISKSSSRYKMSDEQKKKMSRIAKERGFGGNTSKQRLYFKKKMEMLCIFKVLMKFDLLSC